MESKTSEKQVELAVEVMPPVVSEVDVAKKEEEFYERTFNSHAIPQNERISLSNIVFSVQSKNGPPRTILNNVSGIVEAGTVLGVLGPSGCGKTTLLDFLAGRISKSSGTSTGDVLVNGAPRSMKTFHHIAKYVPQEDLLVGTMSVKETLMFAADLTLPEAVDNKEKEQRVDQTIQELGLLNSRDTKIGTVFQKGVSGGQKRRVSMGVELLTRPKLLFLDEPTSGLDSKAAFNVVTILKGLANAGAAVMCTIHQPSSDVFHKLDRVMLLSAGQVVYFGSTHDVVPYFSTIGKQCPPYTNPADFMLDICNTDFEIENTKAKQEVQRLIKSYDESNPKKQLLSIIGTSQENHQQKQEKFDDDFGFETSFWKQFKVLCKRTWLDNLRNPGIFWVRLAMYLILSFMIGTMYLNIDNGQKSMNDRASILFFVAAFLVFMSISVVPAFISDRAVFQRERANGMYNVAAYVLANTVCGLPGLFMIALVSSALIYPMVGLNDGGGRFGIFLLDLFISLWCAESMMLLISSLVPFYIIGMALGAGVFGMFMLCEGFFLLKENIPPYWIWGYYIAFHTYSFEMFMYNEFDGLRVDCDEPIGNTGQCRFNSGNEVLSFYSMNNVNIGHDIAIIICMGIIYRILFYYVLYKYHTGKR